MDILFAIIGFITLLLTSAYAGYAIGRYEQVKERKKAVEVKEPVEEEGPRDPIAEATALCNAGNPFALVNNVPAWKLAVKPGDIVVTESKLHLEIQEEEFEPGRWWITKCVYDGNSGHNRWLGEKSNYHVTSDLGRTRSIFHSIIGRLDDMDLIEGMKEAERICQEIKEGAVIPQSRVSS